MSIYSKSTILVGTFAASLLIGSFPTLISAKADEATIENFTGLDGIIASCIVSTKRKYAAKMCTSLAENGANIAGVNGVEYFFAGSRFAGKTEIVAAAGNLEDLQLKNPLNVEFFIRGTEGKTAGASIRIAASVIYQQAVENSGDRGSIIPRSGKLVLWEEAAVANGPANRMGKALSAHMSKKLKMLIILFSQRKIR